MASPLFGPKARFFDNNGYPLSGGKVYTYFAGTTTPLSSYTTSAGNVANTNPVILDSSGYADIYLGPGSYKIVLQDSTGNQLFSTDNYQGDSSAGFASTIYPITANSNITSSYQNGVLNCTNTINLSLLPAASAGAGFSLVVNNIGTGVITIDPNASELINGAATLTLGSQYASTLLSCDGTQWFALFITSGLKPNVLNTTQTSLASASTTDLGTIASQNVLITGTTTITAFGSSASTASPLYFIEFNGALTLTHNGTSLIIPGAANITTAAGDNAIVEYLGSGNWRVRHYSPATGRAVGSPVSPTRQYLTSGSSATYTTPANCKAIVVKMIGGGGGGAGAGSGLGASGNGGDTIFNSIHAAGGSGAANPGATSSPGGTGGTGGTGSAQLRIAGAAGNSAPSSSSVGQSGGIGGSGPWGGAGANGNYALAGVAASNNSGSGGGGGGSTATTAGGGGGGAGEYAELYISSPAGTYTYTIGAAGTAGTGTHNGAAGGTGLIIVEEYY
jgi:hypothetical protein